MQADAAPDSSDSLEYYLCGAGSSQLRRATTLNLSRGTHHLTEGPFCLLQNVEDLRILSEDGGATIRCADSETGRGVGFFNVTNLFLSNLTVTNCGGVIPAGLPGYVNDTYAYLGSMQKAVFILTHCSNTLLDTITIHGCLGFDYKPTRRAFSSERGDIRYGQQTNGQLHRSQHASRFILHGEWNGGPLR